MNEKSCTMKLGDFFTDKQAWGAALGRRTREKLGRHIATQPGAGVLKLSMQGMKRIDVAFAGEAIIALAMDYLGKRPFCVVDLADADVRANLAAAAETHGFPVMVWDRHQGVALGLRRGAAQEALAFILKRGEARAAEFAAASEVSISNASSRFNWLWRNGLLLRTLAAASSGGNEYVYRPVGQP